MTAPSQRLLKLHRALGLVSAQAGLPAPAPPAWGPVALDWAYGERPTLLQARLDARIATTAAYGAAGLEALAASPSPAAATVLANALSCDLTAIESELI